VTFEETLTLEHYYYWGLSLSRNFDFGFCDIRRKFDFRAFLPVGAIAFMAALRFGHKFSLKQRCNKLQVFLFDIDMCIYVYIHINM